MKLHTALTAALSVLLLLASLDASAQNVWVEDRLEVTARTGASTSHRVVRILRSGTPLEVIERDAESGYTHVRMADGRDGWVLSRFLMNEPAARERLVGAQQRIAELTQQNGALQTQLREIRGEARDVTAARDRAAAEEQRLSGELERLRELSANAIQLDDSNRQLRSTLARNQQLIDNLTAEVDRLKRSERQDWFLVGAGVLGSGMLLGLILPKLRPRRKSSWGDL